MEEGRVLPAKRPHILWAHLKEGKSGFEKMGWVWDLAGDDRRPIGYSSRGEEWRGGKGVGESVHLGINVKKERGRWCNLYDKCGQVWFG